MLRMSVKGPYDYPIFKKTYAPPIPWAPDAGTVFWLFPVALVLALVTLGRGRSSRET